MFAFDHCKVNRRLIHIKDETPVTVAAGDDAVHVDHVVGSLACNFGGGAMRSVDAHSIGHRMGTDPALHRTAVHGEGLLARNSVGRSKHIFDRVNDEPLLPLLKDIAEQGFIDCCQLARWARV